MDKTNKAFSTPLFTTKLSNINKKTAIYQKNASIMSSEAISTKETALCCIL
jgi:hypothetical protein